MTDQSNIPVPPSDEPDKEKGHSLIERAVDKFDLGNFLPPPVPGKLASERRPKRAVGQRKAEVAAPEAPAVKLPPSAKPAEPVVTDRPAEAAATPKRDAAPVQAVKPVTFTGDRHPVDRDRLREQGFIVPEGAVTALLEEFRIVKRQLLVNAADLRGQGSSAAAQRVLISSPHPGEGKTYCAVNLALSIAAEMENEVLLVDADFAKPSILSVLGLPGGPGLMDALTDPSTDVADFVIGTDIPGLWVLPAGNTTTADTEYLSSSRTARVLDRLTEGAPHRFVIFDSPPALAASPAAELAKYVAQVVMIVRADRTGQGALDDAVSLLSACPNIQLLLNAVHFSPSGRSFGKYYGYGG